MYVSVKKAHFQVSKDIFPTEAWELITLNRKSDNLVAFKKIKKAWHGLLSGLALFKRTSGSSGRNS